MFTLALPALNTNMGESSWVNSRSLVRAEAMAFCKRETRETTLAIWGMGNKNTKHQAKLCNGHKCIRKKWTRKRSVRLNGVHVFSCFVFCIVLFFDLPLKIGSNSVSILHGISVLSLLFIRMVTSNTSHHFWGVDWYNWPLSMLQMHFFFTGTLDIIHEPSEPKSKITHFTLHTLYWHTWDHSERVCCGPWWIFSLFVLTGTEECGHCVHVTKAVPLKTMTTHSCYCRDLSLLTMCAVF